MRLALLAPCLIGLLAAAGSSAAQAPEGEALFARHCAPCHQPDASGTVGLAPALKGPHWQRLGAERGYLPTVLVHGLSGAIEVNGQRFVGSMMPFANQLDDAALAAIANHLRGLQGAADAPPYTAADFQAARERSGSAPATRQWRSELLAR